MQPRIALAALADRACLSKDAVVDVVVPRAHVCHIVPQRHPNAGERNLPCATKPSNVCFTTNYKLLSHRGSSEGRRS